ncbi:4Fe-4S binding protein [Carboxydothermus ferrireducens]|uniref:Polyferredoxin n=1 Tax=Carboxydothermus ferrireducens DSM 11255 TaxID=1119529 RepID=A0ABX2RCG4_9THEO|nr:4Fe-4S binding protein [Carboxydothermus ferrireducens]NYE57806.1 polyferredoxin [Carboxydothermus ferrireducens DSM 11255]
MNQVLKNILKSRWYPVIFQIITLFFFSIVIYTLITGPASPHDNFGTALTWVLWWPIIPLIFLLLGRFWCAICPFATINDFVQKFAGMKLKVPNFLKKYGIWIIDATFIIITWSDHIWGIVENPRGSGILLLLITTGVIFSGVLFERRTWCRYLCFLGGLAGNYSRTGMLKLRATPDICKNCTTLACYKGSKNAPGCPLFEVPRNMQTSATCNLCGYCVKNCPNDSINISFKPPASELWFIKRPRLEESFLAIVIMGIVFVQNLTMLEIWQKWQKALTNILHTDSYPVLFTVLFLIAMTIPVVLTLVASKGASYANRQKTWENFARYGYSLIPLDLAGHIAHNLFHLLAEGKSIYYTGLAFFTGKKLEGMSTAIVSSSTITFLQYTILVLGAILSLYTAWKIAKNNEPKNTFNVFLPFSILIIIFLLINIYLFMLPMAMRM